MTHEDLRKQAIKWLTNTNHCGVVLSELSSVAGEIPDAIGWNAGRSILIECKASRSDFLRNGEKCSERTKRGMGQRRYFLCPPHMILEADVENSDWGLLWSVQGRIRVVRDAPYREAIRDGEIDMLVSALRRVRAREFLVLVPEAEPHQPDLLGGAA